jgi:PAS domain S-box-containing protein
LDPNSATAPLTVDVPYELPQKENPDLTWLNRRLRDLLMQAPSAIGITAGPEHRWVYVNEARAAMAGRGGVRDFLGKTVRETYPELEGLAFFSTLDEVYRSGVPFIGKELLARFRRGPGGATEEAYVDCFYQPIRNPDGNVEGILIHTIEVTEKVLARRAVELANERESQGRAAAEFERNQLRQLFEQSSAGVATLSGPQHRWSFVNPAYCRMAGRSAQELLNRPVRETLPELESQPFFDLLDEVYRSGKPYVGKEARVVLNRGLGHAPEEAYFDFIYQPVRNMAGEVEGIMTMAVEVTSQLLARNELEARVQERTLELQQAHESLRTLSGCLMQAQDEERRRVARELHDSAGQYLAAIQMNLASLANDPEIQVEGLQRRIADTITQVAQCTSEIRTLSYLLHPPLLDEVGLASALSWYVEGFAQRSGISVSLDVPKALPRLSPEVETALFRIVQQSLTNIHRHAESKVARIRLLVERERVKLEITDQGRGFQPEILSRFRQSGYLPGMGVSGMRERVNALHGTFEVISDGSGTTISAIVPIRPGA